MGTGPRGQEKGPFKSLFDFCVRVDRARLNKRTLEALIKAGAFDALHDNRAALVASIDRAFEFANAQIANANQGGLFDLMGEDSHGSSTQEPDIVEVPAWGVRERLVQEKAAVGFYLSGHLFDEVEAEVRCFVRTKIAELQDSREPQILAGIVSDLRWINGQRGRLALFKLDDKSCAMDASVEEGVVQAQHDRELLKDDEFVVLSGRLQLDHFSGGLRVKVQQLWSLADARCRFGRYVQVPLGGPATAPLTLESVARVLQDFPARVLDNEQGELRLGLRPRVALRCVGAQGSAIAEVQLGESARMYPSNEALAAWSVATGGAPACVVYD